MKRWIRWKGLLAFAAAVIVITLVWVLVVDAVVRRGIEYVGTRAVGARVDLAKADLSLFPTGLELIGLAVTNPDAPMQNAVEIGRMKMDLDPGYLIRRKVIIGDMVAEGMRFGTPRKVSGAVPSLTDKPAEEKKADGGTGTETVLKKVCGDFSMPSLSQPDVKAILAKESLSSVQTAQDLKSKIEADKKHWEKELTRLADEKTLKDYEARIKKLKGAGGSLGSLLGAAGDVNQLQADIRKDLKLLQKAKTAFSEDLATYRRQVGSLAQAPLADVKRLAEKYSLTSSGLGNLSQLIFGERLCSWMGTVVEWYGKIRPYLDRIPKGTSDKPVEQKPLRGKGVNIRFVETPSIPDFLIRNMKISADLTAGKFSGKIENVTLDQHILGSPTTFAFLGKNMPHIDALSLIGTANYIDPSEPKNDAQLALKGLGLANLPLVQEESFPLTVKHAMGNLNLNLSTVDEVLDAAVKADFNTVKFVADAGKEQNAIAGALAAAVANVNRFSLKADVKGTVEAYTVDVKSDLDKVLKSAVGNLVSAQSDKFKAALKEAISQRLQGPMAGAQGSLAGLDAIEAELTKRLNLGDDLLKGLKLPF
jgi:uncharacterized protein (TIGR03545 family)